MMEFLEVTHALAKVVPFMTGVRVWHAEHGGYTWAIAFEPGHPSWSEEERAANVGYTATYRRRDHNRSSQTIKIDGGPWPTFTAAERACRQVWKQLRNAN